MGCDAMRCDAMRCYAIRAHLDAHRLRVLVDLEESRRADTHPCRDARDLRSEKVQLRTGEGWVARDGSLQVSREVALYLRKPRAERDGRGGRVAVVKVDSSCLLAGMYVDLRNHY